MNLILFDENRRALLPLTFTRPVGDLRIGIYTMRERWQAISDEAEVSFYTEAYLSGKFPAVFTDDNIAIHGGAIPGETLAGVLLNLPKGTVMRHGNTIIGFRGDEAQTRAFLMGQTHGFAELQTTFDCLFIQAPWDIFRHNDAVLRQDFALITKGRTSQPLSTTNTLIGDPSQLFLEEGSSVEASVLNVKTGPIYVGKDAEILEGCLVRGGLAMCEHSALKMGAKIYGATTLGPHCKVGGEVNNAVMQAYSNKGHEGFVGNSVIGEWCNIGADTNTSNLKNNYAEVKLWNYDRRGFARTGLQFCGLIMGDHAKCGINTMFNTGTVVGVSANVFGAGYPRNFIPDFAWGGASGFTVFDLPTAYDVAARMMERRGLVLSDDDKSILSHIFDETAEHRKNL